MNSKKSKTHHSLDSENDLESNGSTTKPNDCLGKNSRVTCKKKKLSMNHVKSPRKRRNQNGASTRLEVQATKRKACCERETPKKQRCGSTVTNAGEPTKAGVVSCEGSSSLEVQATKRKACSERETPKKQRCGSTVTNAGEPTKAGVVSCEGSSSPSTSRENGSTLYNTGRDNFEAKYLELEKFGEGGFGSVYAGNRRSDSLPVAIKHIPKADVECRPRVFNGKTYMVPIEVLLMLRAACGPESVGKSAAVSLLDWYDLDQEVLLVMERPVPSVDLLHHLDDNNGPLSEDQAKNIMKQLVEAAIQMISQGVFHRDIKTENVLIETGSEVPRARVIDFGCGCFVRKTPYRSYSGTSAYAPPEFYREGSYKAGPTTVWQLGALLFEILDGNKQFITSDFLSRKIKFNHSLSYDCQNLLKVCLAVNPKQRATLEQIQQHPWFR